MVTLWERRWSREGLLACLGRLEQVAGIRLIEGGDGAERGVRMLRGWSGAGFEFEILVDRGFDIGGLVRQDAIDRVARQARGPAESPA